MGTAVQVLGWSTGVEYWVQVLGSGTRVVLGVKYCSWYWGQMLGLGTGVRYWG